MIIHGDCLRELKALADNSVDSIVTDPPYGLSFMGKKWDYEVPSVEIWKECLRVLKPGGHLLSFAGTRTYHRMACNIEDAGFEIRDQIMWLYGSGFPKSHAVDKGIDKIKGVSRKVIGTKTEHNIKGSGENSRLQTSSGKRETIQLNITEATSDEAKQWQGWGTALKPANEPIVVARKPLEKGLTVAENVLKYGTGALNIDVSRIETSDNLNGGRYSDNKQGNDGNSYGSGINLRSANDYVQPSGRWPANVLLDEEAAAALDFQSGTTKSGTLKGTEPSATTSNAYGDFAKRSLTTHGDAGGASRFFYVAKASKKERGEGNVHPTVKPVKLMEYLIKLVTPPLGKVLDPFAGSGTTLLAAIKNDFAYIGIEREAEYVAIARARIKDAKDSAS